VSASAGCLNVAGTVDLHARQPGAASAANVTDPGDGVARGDDDLSTPRPSTGGATDPASGNNADTEPTRVLLERAEAELVHGTRLAADLAAWAAAPTSTSTASARSRTRRTRSRSTRRRGTWAPGGPAARPRAERRHHGPAGVAARGRRPQPQLRFANTTSATIDDHLVRVRSGSCGSDCGPDDVYRIRSWETTGFIPRFNNSATQVTVLMLQNRSTVPVTGTVYFWSATGLLTHQEPIVLVPKGSLILNTSSVTALEGQSGSITVAHDGEYDALVGKGVALEPEHGFSFDSILVSRPR
jgi:hypothetical protein